MNRAGAWVAKKLLGCRGDAHRQDDKKRRSHGVQRLTGPMLLLKTKQPWP